MDSTVSLCESTYDTQSRYDRGNSACGIVMFFLVIFQWPPSKNRFRSRRLTRSFEIHWKTFRQPSVRNATILITIRRIISFFFSFFLLFLLFSFFFFLPWTRCLLSPVLIDFVTFAFASVTVWNASSNVITKYFCEIVLLHCLLFLFFC